MAYSYSQNQKYEILLFGMKYGVSEACKTYGISRTLYYRWKSRLEAEGLNGLADRPLQGGKSKKMNPELERAILSAIRTYPSYGPRSIAWLIQDDGDDIGENTVYRLMKKYNLTTRAQREKYSRNPGEKKQLRQKARMTPLKKLSVSDGFICWTVFWGRLPRLGRIYQYFVLDTRSGFTASSLETKKSSEIALDVLQGQAIPMALNMGMNSPKWVVTQNGSEYTSGNTRGTHKYSATLRELGMNQYAWEDAPKNYLKPVEYLNKYFQKELFPLAMTEDCTLERLRLAHIRLLRDYDFKFPSPVAINPNQKTPFELGCSETKSSSLNVPPTWIQIESIYSRESNICK